MSSCNFRNVEGLRKNWLTWVVRTLRRWSGSAASRIRSSLYSVAEEQLVFLIRIAIRRLMHLSLWMSRLKSLRLFRTLRIVPNASADISGRSALVVAGRSMSDGFMEKSRAGGVG